MRKVSKWMVIVAAITMMGLMSAQVLLADDTKVGAWSQGVSAQVLEGFTGNEAIATEAGTITGITKVPGSAGNLQFKFKADSGSTYTIFVGPKWFIENQKIKFAAKDKVEVRGKKWGSNIIATEISKGDWTMKLRNEEDGLPAWQCCFPRKAE